MTRAIYLHIGAPKTGTTYLQDRLSRNVVRLARRGVHVPTATPLVSPSLFQFRAALDLLEQDWGGRPGHAEGAWQTLLRRIRMVRGTVVVSHEILAAAPPDKVARAVSELGALGELHVVYSARDLARQLPAAWQESIKQGNRWSYRRFLNRVQRRRTWWYESFDLPAVLEKWGADLPAERLHVVTVPARGSAPRDELWHRFCTAFGLDPAWAPRDSEQSNRSLGVAETQVVRRLNNRFDWETRREAAFDVLVRGTLAQKDLAGRTSAPVRLPPDLMPFAEAEAERWIGWLSRSGVRLVGDPEDLRPLPTPDAEWVDPDRVKPKRQLEAAMDALAAMTEEAARRPNPDVRVTSRVRNAADWWR